MLGSRPAIECSFSKQRTKRARLFELVVHADRTAPDDQNFYFFEKEGVPSCSAPTAQATLKTPPLFHSWFDPLAGFDVGSPGA